MQGASGHFMSLAIMSLVTDVELKEPFRAHTSHDKAWYYHNYYRNFSDQKLQKFDHDSDLEQTVKHIQQNYKFSSNIPYPFYVVNTHINNPDALLAAYDNTKLFNIVHTDNDLDQMAYNWITKTLFLYEPWETMRDYLKVIQQTHGRLIGVDPESLTKETDLKLLVYLQKYGLEQKHVKYCSYQPTNKHPVFTIDFQDIASKKVLNQLDALIDFLEIDVSETRRDNTVKLIEQYAEAQTPVPWAVNLEDYN